MSIKVNQDTCIGCGSCVAICPTHFELNSEGKAEVKSQESAPCVRASVDACPVQAITVE